MWKMAGVYNTSLFVLYHESSNHFLKKSGCVAAAASNNENATSSPMEPVHNSRDTMASPCTTSLVTVQIQGPNCFATAALGFSVSLMRQLIHPYPLDISLNQHTEREHRSTPGRFDGQLSACALLQQHRSACRSSMRSRYHQNTGSTGLHLGEMIAPRFRVPCLQQALRLCRGCDRTHTVL